MAERLRRAGCVMLTVHGRLPEAKSRGPVDEASLRELHPAENFTPGRRPGKWKK